MKRIRLTDNSYNSYNMRVITSGGDWSRFKTNPILLYAHIRAGYKDGKLVTPPGRWKDMQFSDTEVTAVPEFDMDDPDAAILAGKYERGFLNAASIGIEPLEVSYDGQDEFGNDLYSITRWRAMEASVTDIPSNGSAIAFYNSDFEPIELSAVIELAAPSSTKIDVPDMKFEHVPVKLGLSADASVDQVNAKIKELQSAQVQLSALQAENEQLKAQVKASRDAEIGTLLSTAKADKKIGEGDVANYRQMLELNFETGKAIIEGLQPRVKLSDIPKTPAEGGKTMQFKYEGKTYTEMMQTDSAALTKLKADSPETFNKLYKAEFGKDYKF